MAAAVRPSRPYHLPAPQADRVVVAVKLRWHVLTAQTRMIITIVTLLRRIMGRLSIPFAA
jgi:hypothetical protein